jgi:hypothetical protein
VFPKVNGRLDTSRRVVQDGVMVRGVVVAVVAVVVLSAATVGGVRAYERLGPGLCATSMGDGVGFPSHDQGSGDELELARADALRLAGEAWRLAAVPGAEGDDLAVVQALINERIAALPAATAAVYEPALVEPRRDNLEQQLAWERINGEHLLLDARIEVRQWGPMAVDGDRAAGCFYGRFAVRSRPIHGGGGPVLDADGYGRWEAMGYVRLSRAPGGPWRLVASYTPSHG